MAQEFLFLLRRIAHVQEHLVLVPQVPLQVLLDVGDEVGVDVAEEVEAVLVQLGGVVGEFESTFSGFASLNN